MHMHALADIAILGFRRLRRQPLSTAAALVTMAMGVGATTAVFGLANWILLRPIPGIADPENLVVVTISEIDAPGIHPFSNPHAERLMAVRGAFTDVAALTPFDADVAPEGAGRPLRFAAEIVSPSYFRVLGVRPMVGRGFEDSDADPGSIQTTAVVSHRFWRDVLGGPTEIVGRRLSLNGSDFRIVGVGPPGFRGLSRVGSTDIWVPTAAAPAVLSRMPSQLLMLPQVPMWRELVGRPASALDPDIERLLASSVPDLVAQGLSPSVRRDAGTPRSVREHVGSLLSVLGGLVALLLFLTSASLCNIVVSRTASGASARAIRSALGATRVRLFQELAAEFCLVAVFGSGAAILMSTAVTGLMRGQRLASWLPPIEGVQLDLRVMSFALLVTLVIAGTAAVVTSVALAGVGPMGGLLGPSARSSRPSRLAALLVAGQLGLSFALLLAATGLVRSLRYSVQERVGFETEGRVVFSLNPGVQGSTDEEADQLFRSLRSALASRVEVDEVAFMWLALGGRRLYTERVAIPEGETVSVSANMVTPGFFEALGITVDEGREFGASEYERSQRPERGAVVVNRSLARLLDPNGSVVGRPIVLPGRREVEFEVIGVVPDVNLIQIGAPAGAALFDPFGNGYRTTSATFLVRSETLEASELLPVVEATARTVAPNLPLLDAQTLDAGVSAHFAELEMLARLAGLFSALATALATIALLGLLSQVSAARVREFGIRRTLGARRGHLAGHVLFEGFRVLGFGLALGAVCAGPAILLLRDRLVGVAPLDPATLGFVCSTLVFTTVVGSSYPALFASTVEPGRALRAD